MNGIFGLAHRIIFKVNARWDWGWKSQRIIKFNPYKIIAIVKHKSFSKYYEILKFSTIEQTKFTIQTFPCINICCFGVENGEFKWFHLYLILLRAFKGKNVGLPRCHNPYVWFNKSSYTGTMFFILCLQ